MHNDLTAYYARRAAEYEIIYAKLERQVDIQTASDLLQTIFQGKNVLEIACGTGFWTEHIAQTAASIWATDINESVLEIAREKNYPRANVHFSAIDLYELPTDRHFDALFGGFIWSHILLQELDRFLSKIDGLINDEGTIVFMDNRFVTGSSTPIDEQDECGNTYQIRPLQNGETHRVLKNFPSKSNLEMVLADYGIDIQVTELPYFWICQYRKNPIPASNL